MEKVVVVHGCNYLDDEEDMEEVNALLEDGWTVKHVSSAATERYVTSIFVLEKKASEDGGCFDEEGEVYLHDDPFDV